MRDSGTVTLPSAAIDQVRAFNRDYTRRLGLLAQGWLDSPYSLTQVRVLYEIAHQPGIQAAELAAALGLDRGYLSRLLKGFESRRLLQRSASAHDARRRHLRLTAAGLRAFAPLERRSQEEVRQLLASIDVAARRGVLSALHTLREACAAHAATGASPITLREHRCGDLGWVIERHGALYFEEFGWNEQFEALVARIVADFIGSFDPVHERCWIAEQDGRRVGCIFLVAESATTAKLRLLLVEPAARGSGLGRQLIEECIRFARTAGYARIVLWTQASLSAARHLYQRAGFVLLAQEPHVSFGHSLLGETWELRLTAAFPGATPRARRAVKR
jgi:DNA-binding MarR family transcriptional regulator/predicted N-acetyltransferase YhbS